ncbi:MAG: peptidylprolyl isomerase [Methylocystaceae bacterium]|nr:peptidylprolyl isomerase [Methylocystaceae bacterium]
MKRFLLSLLVIMGLSCAVHAQGMDKENTLYMDLKNGRVVIQMRPDLAPKHVQRIKELTRAGFYDGIVFHRVIRGFMAQTGDPTGTGMGGSDKPDLPAEFSNALHERGTVSMARASNPNSANSQFFICFKKAASLDGQYTVWGQVVEGMEFVDRIKKGSSFNNGKVTNPDKIIKMQVAADVQ